MTLREFKNLLKANPEKKLVLFLPDGEPVPRHFHITEAGHVRRRFIDCGGGLHDDETCLLQAWVADDIDHSITSGKLGGILDLAHALFPSDEIQVEIEYEAVQLSQYRVSSAESTAQSLLFFLEAKHSDCLAKESCGLAAVPTGCAPGSGCC